MKMLRKLNYLPNYELYLYFAIYFGYLVYSIYANYTLRDEIRNSKIWNRNFVEGWSFLDSNRDSHDSDWEKIKLFIRKNILWFFLHLGISEVTKRNFRSDIIPFVHGIFGGIYIYLQYGLIPLLVLISKILTFYLISLFSFKSLIWSLAILALILLNVFKSDQFFPQLSDYLYSNHGQEFLIILAWTLLRCISISLDKIRSSNAKYYELEHYFGYCLYTPTLFIGPFMIYERYRKMLERHSPDSLKLRSSFWSKFGGLCLSLIIITFWIFFTDFSLHFIYIGNLQVNPNFVEKLDPFALYGMGYLMGQFFHIKYVIAYGLGIALAKMDDIETPRKPICIGRVHLYSDMWKYFDQGLYEFLFIYIYKELCTKTSSIPRKFFASFMTFCFIYLWHGFYEYVLVWSILNYVCLSIENLCSHLSKTRRYQSLVASKFSKNNLLRFNAIVTSQLFIPAAISNFYFFAGLKIGYIFIWKTYTGGIINYFFLTICCISIYHTSEIVKRIQAKKK